jgi:hypothetical protein
MWFQSIARAVLSFTWPGVEPAMLLKTSWLEIIGLQIKFSCCGVIRNSWVSFFLNWVNSHLQALGPCLFSLSGLIPGRRNLEMPVDCLGGPKASRRRPGIEGYKRD